MDSIFSFLTTGGFSFVVFLLIAFFCLLGMIASGKVAETFSLLVASSVSYGLCVGYGPSLFQELGDLDKMRASISSIPFLETWFPDSSFRILGLLHEDLPAFTQHLFYIFVLTVFVNVIFSISRGLIQQVQHSGNFWISSLSFFLKYIACIAAMWLYIAFSGYVFSGVSSEIISKIAYVIFILLVLVLLTPLVDYLLAAANITSLPMLKNISTFVKSNPVGGNLQPIFFSSFLMTCLMIILQEVIFR